jgi:Na+/H+ antiporter NhaD/arsenite permease-like protein
MSNDGAQLTFDKVLVLVAFGGGYSLLALTRLNKAYIVWGAIVGLAITRVLPVARIPYDIHWNVIGVFAGTLLLTGAFIYSRVPAKISNILVAHAPNLGMAMLAVCLISSALSVVVENVATVLIVAPIALEMARKQKVSPIPFLIGIAVCSNLQGTATLIGDPPSMILAASEHMSFNDFFVFHGKPSIFWAVEAGGVVSFVILWLLFRRNRQKVEAFAAIQIESWAPTVLLAIMIMGLAFSSLVDPDFNWAAGTLCMVVGLLSLVIMVLEGEHSRQEVKTMIKVYDWETTFFLMGVFVLVAMLVRAGLVADFASLLSRTLGRNPFLVFVIIVWASVGFSAFIDNVPYITAMIPVVQIVAIDLGISRYLLIFGLLIGSCLGGNITPVGASANIVAAGALKREGYHVSFWQFARIGLPFTVAATVAGMAVVWAVWR